jgi:signal transduction histidine kinase/signal recognition particle receptor subunit beta
MAQWNRTDRTLVAKLVYYGPALGGKTTNLRVLHRLTDPEGTQKLIAVNTADDRTLFFDLLPFDLGSVLGYKVALKLYTVPGQVRYDATRRVVLAGADAVVFVADSDPSRAEDDRASWEDLTKNLRASGADPSSIPVVAQLNKRDLPGALSEATMASWFGLPPARVVPSIAADGAGVLETFLAASRAMLERLVALAEPSTRRTLEGDLGAQLERAFAPHLARRRPSSLLDEPVETTALVAGGENLLESALATSLALSSENADAHARLVRLEREADALRRLSDVLRATGATFERGALVRAALAAAVSVLGADAAALVSKGGPRGPRLEHDHEDRLALLLGSPEGAALVARMLESDGPCVLDDVADEIGPVLGSPVARWCAIASIPIQAEAPGALLVAMPAPDRGFSEGDVRFLATLAGHLSAGLEKARAHAEVAAERDRLEETVRERTRALRCAYEDLRALDAAKDRLLAGVSHEMRTPLTAIVSAASFLEDYDGARAQRAEMAGTIREAAGTLGRLIDGLLRVARIEAPADAALAATPPEDVVAEALRLAHATGAVSVLIDPRVESVPADLDRLARALANLVDNALKFGPPDEEVEVRLAPCVLAQGGSGVRGIALSVLDRGPGLADDEVERAFAPFEQGGHALTGKPSGLGLGLYEARAIAQRHGGTLIHLPRTGGGSEFRISVPAGDPLAVLTEARRA